MLRAIIVDDEENGRETLLYSLKEVCPDVEVISMADSVETGLQAIKDHGPELLFLDIEMPSGSGFDLLQQIPNIDFDIIFTTAYDQYAIKAFKFSATDYLLKPVNMDELKSAVDMVKNNKVTKETFKQYEILKENLEEKDNSFHRLALPTSDGLDFIELKNIIRCAADGNYTLFYLTNGKKIIVGKTLKEYDELLSDHNFFRTHKSHLINLEFMTKYVKGIGGYVIMSDGSEVEVAKRRKESFMERLSHV